MFQSRGPTRFICLHEPVTPWLSLPVDQLIEYPRWLVLCQMQLDATERLWQDISFLVLSVGITCGNLVSWLKEISNHTVAKT